MIEDTLTHDERVRLEALAIASRENIGMADAQWVVSRASVYESYIRDGKPETT